MWVVIVCGYYFWNKSGQKLTSLLPEARHFTFDNAIAAAEEWNSAHPTAREKATIVRL